MANNAHWKAHYGPWAVVTGASDGIGKAIATELATRGMDLVLVARRQDKLAQLARELEAQFAIETHVIAADLSTQAGVETVVEGTQALKVGLLIAAAGYGTSGNFIDRPLDQELNMLAVNCGAVVALSHHFGNRFVAQGHGGLVLFSSLVAFQGVPRSAHYAATKAYVQSLAEALHHELAPSGVTVLASAPGPVRSGFAARADMRLGAALSPQVVARDTLNALGKKAQVRPGLLSKCLIGSLHMMPRFLRVRAMKIIMGSMTHHQTAPATVFANPSA